MLRITSTIVIEERELSFSFLRSSGPGGQHVNKVSTAVQLHFDAAAHFGLQSSLIGRLRCLAGRRMTTDGVLVLTASRLRSQERNRVAVLDRLVELLRLAARAPRVRHPSKPSRTERLRRLEHKNRRGSLKRLRSTLRNFDTL